MAGIARLTNNTDETDIASFLSKDNIFSIPFFQRPYKWKPDRVKRFQDDVLSLVDETNDFHFLGAVIIHGRRTNPSDPDIYEVIDGQQRLTTIFLMLCACIKTLCEAKEYDEAAGLLQKYVIINRNLSTLSNARVHSCKEDRAQMNSVIRDILSAEQLTEKLGGFRFKQLPIATNTRDRGVLRNNYLSMLRFAKSEIEEGGITRLRDIYGCLLNKVTIVQIDVKDPASGPAIFDSLNSRQEPMTIGDLVRNGIFAKVADLEPDEIEAIDQDYWQPFYNSFEFNGRNYFDAYFFPFGLIENPNLKKSEVYDFLQQQWSDTDDAKKIIKELEYHQAAFMDIMCGTNIVGHDFSVSSKIQRLYELGLPSSALPFAMQLSTKTGEGVIDSTKAAEIFDCLESFLVRRAICGIEPTGLHAVFKRLWKDIGDEISAKSVTEAIKSHKTVTWPTDEEVIKSIKLRPLYGASVTPFLIREYDRGLGGDIPEEKPWLEHILPQKLSDDWKSTFTESQHSTAVDTIANLTPLTRLRTHSQ